MSDRIHLVSPDGEAYSTTSKAEATRLRAAHGYTKALPAEVERPIRRPVTRPAPKPEPNKPEVAKSDD